MTSCRSVLSSDNMGYREDLSARNASAGWTRKVCVFLFGLCMYSTVKLMVYINAHLENDDISEILPLPHWNSSQFTLLKTIEHMWPDTDITIKPTKQPCGMHLLSTPASFKSLGCTKNCHDITCHKLLFGNGSESSYGLAEEWLEEHTIISKPESFLADAAENCSQFLHGRGYIMTAPVLDEVGFPIAYSILMHNATLQFERLLHAIYRPHNTYCLHVDAKSHPDVLKSVRALTKCLPNVFIASQLQHIVYAGFSRLQADINCMKDLIDHPVPWHYAISIPSNSYPLKTNSEIVKILRIYNHSNDIAGQYGPGVSREEFEFEWAEGGVFGDVETSTSGGVRRTGRRNLPPPYDIDLVKGTGYGILSRKFVEWALSDVKAKSFLNWLRTSWGPEQHFWATLHHTFSNPQLSPPGGYAGIPNSKPSMVIYSPQRSRDRCNGNWEDQFCLLGIRDIPAAIRRHELFTQIVASHKQPLVFDCLEAWHKYRENCPAKLDSAFYNNLPFVNERPVSEKSKDSS